MAGRSDDPEARQYLSVAVEQFELGVHEIEPLGKLGRFAPGPVQFRALDVEGCVLEYRVLPAVVEMQVRVNDQADVAGREVKFVQGVGNRPIDNPPVV